MELLTVLHFCVNKNLLVIGKKKMWGKNYRLMHKNAKGDCGV